MKSSLNHFVMAGMHEDCATRCSLLEWWEYLVGSLTRIQFGVGQRTQKAEEAWLDEAMGSLLKVANFQCVVHQTSRRERQTGVVFKDTAWRRRFKYLSQDTIPHFPSKNANMSYWDDHKVEIITWAVVGLALLSVVTWCFYEPLPANVRPVLPAWHHGANSTITDIELAPLPQAFIPAPLYDLHECDLWLPSDTELEKRADGYYYPKYMEDWRREQ